MFGTLFAHLRGILHENLGIAANVSAEEFEHFRPVFRREVDRFAEEAKTKKKIRNGKREECSCRHIRLLFHVSRGDMR